MQSNRGFFEELKYQYNFGGMHVKLIFVNVIFFAVIGILNAIANLSANEDFKIILAEIFTLHTEATIFITRPWGLITSIFSHFDILHLALNMMMLYFSGKIFLQFFSNNRFLAVYILGGILGGIVEILAHSLIPTLANMPVVVVGASGSIMAVFIGLAFYKPSMPISFFNLITFPIIYLGIIFLLLNLISLGLNDGTAHFAHLGGAIVGVLASQKPHSKSNIVALFESFLVKFLNFFTNFKNSSSSNSKKDIRKMKDEDFNLDKKKKQEKTNIILDKISKSGYESLSKAEKEFLFKQSNNG